MARPSGVPVERIREETTSAGSRSSDSALELKSITSRLVNVDANDVRERGSDGGSRMDFVLEDCRE